MAAISLYKGLSYGELHGLMTVQLKKIDSTIAQLNNLLSSNGCSDFASAMANHSNKEKESEAFIKERDELLEQLKNTVDTIYALKAAQDSFS